MRRAVPWLVLFLLASMGSPSRMSARELAADSADFPIPSADAYVDSLAIRVPAGTPRSVLYTNKVATWYATMTTGTSADSNQGLNVYGRRVLDDYRLAVGGRVLARGTAEAAEVFPHMLRRHYPGGTVEEVALLDRLDALVVHVRAPDRATVGFEAVLPGATDGGGFDIRVEGATIVATPKVGGDLGQTTPRPLVIASAAPVATLESPAAASGFVPGRISVPGGDAWFVVVAGRDRTDALDVVRRVGRDPARLLAERKARIGNLLLDTYVKTDDARFDKALAWLKASGDALMTEQAGPGIWAGLYWFNNYWGRDTFISLPGICLVTGRLGEARRILESFARFQKTDPSDPLFGRIPNRVVSPTDIIYNTADGTPWFVREAYEYVRYSGDLAFAHEIYPAVRRATDGTIEKRTDANGLLVHEDADTWMDAQIEGRIPWSPRGNRAVDVQALWYAQLDASARLAHLVSDKEAAERWERFAARVKRAFREQFFNERGTLADHLNVDGSRDGKIRPNEIFALTVPFDPLVTKPEGRKIVREVVTELTYPYGVASLSQRDPDFHPYHHDPRWHYDAAYHNGTVWVWNAGPVISSLVDYHREDLAYALTTAMVAQTLDLGSVGTLSELVDAIPRDGRLGLSGTETQAWSIGEFVRVVYQDYLGVRPDLVAGSLRLSPTIPKSLGTVHAVVPYGEARLKVGYERLDNGRTRCTVLAKTLREPFEVVFGPASQASPTAAAAPATVRNGRAITAVVTRQPLGPDAALGTIAFAKPQIIPGLRALAPAFGGIVRATADEAARPEPVDAAVLVDVDDPAYDDTGPSGGYTYPLDQNYEPGILDVTHVRVSADADRYYVTLKFRHLVDPGWHPELGFQLTFIAVAFDLDGIPGSGAALVGRGAAFSLPTERAFERVVYVGGGLQVDDAEAKTLLTYHPVDRSSALGDARASVVRFSVPRTVIGDWKQRSHVSVLVGGQDDGGTAGLGAFRAVDEKASQWAGGGGGVGASRVYDVVMP